MTFEPGGYVNDLSFASTDLQPSDRSFVLWIARGLNDVPTVRGTDDIVPHKTGQTARSRKADKLPIELRGWVTVQAETVSAAVAEFRTTVETLKALFDPTDSPASLTATLEDGSTAAINARTLALLIEEAVPSHAASISIQMESLDPAWVITPAGS